jgi:hypothetical protein
MGKFGKLPLAALVFLAAAEPAAAKEVEKIEIRADSADALLVFKANPVPVPSGYKTAWRMPIQGYDPVENKMVGGLEILAGRPKSFVDGFLVERVKPGTYAFQSFSRQDYWALCFNGDSLQFTVKPGEVLYLGEFDAASHVMELERLTVATGRTTSRNSEPIHFFDTVSPPAFAPIDEAGLAAAAAMIKARMPGTNVAPKPASFSKARFGTGKDLFGLRRICGGYYQKKAK